MTVPLMVLAFLSIVGGFVGIPHALGGSNWIEGWLAPVFEQAEMKIPAGHEGALSSEYLLMGLSIAVALTGIVVARRIYIARPEIAEKLRRAFGPIYSTLLNKYYLDEIYDAAVVRPIKKGSEILLWKWMDVGLVDGLVNGTATLVGLAGQKIRKVQVGGAQVYAAVIVGGIILVLGMLMFK